MCEWTHPKQKTHENRVSIQKASFQEDESCTVRATVISQHTMAPWGALVSESGNVARNREDMDLEPHADAFTLWRKKVRTEVQRTC